MSPARRRGCIEHVVAKLGASERTACRVLGQHRSTQRKVARTADDEAALTADVVELARRHGRHGYRRIAALLRHAGWRVNRKRVERIWRREGLEVPARHPKRDRLWLADGSCVRLRPERANQIWAYDFVEWPRHSPGSTTATCAARRCRPPPASSTTALRPWPKTRGRCRRRPGQSVGDAHDAKETPSIAWDPGRRRARGGDRIRGRTSARAAGPRQR